MGTNSSTTYYIGGIHLITYGYVKGYHYTGDGTLMIQVRIPSIHGAYKQTDYKGQKIRNYTDDGALPWYPSVLLPHLPREGEVVAIATLDDNQGNMLVIGLTGGSYQSGITNLQG